MREFYRPFRRKLGLLTLVMACLFVAGWVRSITFDDRATFQFRRSWMDGISSYDSSLIWVRIRKESTSGIAPTFSSAKRLDAREVWRWPFVDWQWRKLGFGHGCDAGGAKQNKNFIFHTSPTVVTVVPYWSIVLPLTAISAWLLLSKPKHQPPTRG